MGGLGGKGAKWASLNTGPKRTAELGGRAKGHCLNRERSRKQRPSKQAAVAAANGGSTSAYSCERTRSCKSFHSPPLAYGSGRGNFTMMACNVTLFACAGGMHAMSCFSMGGLALAVAKSLGKL
eukprot:UN1942